MSRYPKGPIPEERGVRGDVRRRFRVRSRDRGPLQQREIERAQRHRPAAGLARTSRTPGRTQAVNLFELEPGRRLVDLPGYGHAHRPGCRSRRAWARLMDAYFAERESLCGLLIVVDARRGFGESDEAMLGYALARARPVACPAQQVRQARPERSAPGAGDGAPGAGRTRRRAVVLGGIGRRRQTRRRARSRQCWRDT